MSNLIGIRGALLLLLSLAASTTSMAYTELTAQYSHQERIYGERRQNELTTDTVYSSLAFYFLQNTALEFNYTNEKQEDSVISSDLKLNGLDVRIRSLKRVKTAVSGIGIRQALAGRKSTFRPAISLGYARKTVYSSTDFTMYDIAGGTSSSANQISPVVRQNSVFGSISLSIRLGRRISWVSSVQTVVKASKINRASDNMKYMTGLSLIL